MPLARFSRVTVLIAITLILMLFLSACGRQGAIPEEPITIRVASYAGAEASPSVSLKKWAEQVEKETGGAVKFDFFFSGSLIGPTEMLQATSDGRVDIGFLTPNYTPERLGLAMVTDIPFITRNSIASAHAFYELNDTNEQFAQEFKKNGVRLSGVWPLGEGIIISNREVTSPDDFKGASIRSSGYSQELFSAAGANNVSMGAGEVYEALDRGTIDMAGNMQIDSAADRSLYEVSDHFTATGQGVYATTITVINEETWESLPSDVRQVMDDTARQSLESYVKSDMKQNEDRACAKAKKAGVTVSELGESEVAAFEKELGTEVYDQYVANGGSAAGAVHDQYERLTEEYAQESDFVTGMQKCADAL